MDVSGVTVCICSDGTSATGRVTVTIGLLTTFTEMGRSLFVAAITVHSAIAVMHRQSGVDCLHGDNSEKGRPPLGITGHRFSLDHQPHPSSELMSF